MIWLASFPRSGNTFLRIALEKLYGLQSLSLYEDDPASLSRRASHVHSSLQALHASQDLHFIKTHELPDDGSPAILLVRDGRDAMVSFTHFIQDYGVVRWSLMDRLDAHRRQLLNGTPPFDQLLRKVILREHFDWSAHYLAWRTRPAGCAVVHFESLVREPADAVRQSLGSLGIELPSRGERLPDFDQLHAQDPKFFRAGTSGQWRTEMSPELEDLFWREHGDAMLDAGYRR